jgi:iron complex transport system substrate-binding protein
MKDEAARRPAREGGFIFHLSSLILVLLVSCGERGSGRVIDDLGRSVEVPSEVSRVVTLAPGLSEIVHAIGSAHLLAGTDDYSNFPPEIARLPKVGGMEPSREKIAELDPDLVIASTSAMHPQLISTLEAMNVPLAVVRTDRLSEIPRAMTLIGELLGSPDTEKARKEFASAVEAQRRKRSPAPKVLFVIWADPLYVAVAGTHLGDILELTGVENAARSANARSLYSLEAVVANPPDLILYPSGTGSPEALLSLLNARRPGRPVTAHSVEEDLFMRPGPRLPRAAAALNRIVDEWEGE